MTVRGLVLAALVALSVARGWHPAEAAPRSKEPYRIEQMVLVRDDGRGKERVQVTSFRPGDNPLRCVIRLNKGKKGLRIHFRWTVIEGDGEKNLVVLQNVYTTRDAKDLSVANEWRRKTAAWPPGKYKVDAAVEGAKEMVTIEFLIK